MAHIHSSNAGLNTVLTDVYIGMGSNLANKTGNSIKILQWAIQQLSGLGLTTYSNLYLTKPIGPQDQPDYYNAVAKLQTALTPKQLLSQLQNIEQLADRQRIRHWGERTLDLDILLYGDSMINEPNLTVPHPQMHNRAFVLKPLSDIHKHYCVAGINILQHPLTQQKDIVTVAINLWA